MDTLIHADIFFFVTTFAVIAVAAALTVVLIRLSRILGDIKEITEHVHDETVLVRKDIGELRNQIKTEGFKLVNVVDTVMGFFKKHKSTRSKTK